MERGDGGAVEDEVVGGLKVRRFGRRKVRKTESPEFGFVVL